MNKMTQTILIVFGRVFILYIIGFFILHWLIKPVEVTKINLAVLDRLRPEEFLYKETINYLLGFHKKEYLLDRSKLEPYRYYFQKVSQYLPKQADAYGMQGYCAYYLGDSNAAVKAYKKALELNPSFFWFYYNLGNVYLANGQYQEAQDMFQKAVIVDPQQTFLYIPASPGIYLPNIVHLAPEGKSWDQFAREEIKEGFIESYKLLILTQYHLKNYEAMFAYAHAAIGVDLNKTQLFSFYAAVAACELKKYSVTVNFLQQYIKNNPETPEAYHYLALGLKELGQEVMAVMALRQKERLLQKGKTESLLIIPETLDLHLY